MDTANYGSKPVLLVHKKNRWCLWTLNDVNHISSAPFHSHPEPMQVVAIKRIKLNPDDDEGIPPGDLTKGETGRECCRLL